MLRASVPSKESVGVAQAVIAVVAAVAAGVVVVFVVFAALAPSVVATEEGSYCKPPLLPFDYD